MKPGFYFPLFVLLMGSCQPEVTVFSSFPHETYVGYKLVGDTLHVARLLENGSQHELHRAVLIEGQETVQQAAQVQKVSTDSLAKVKSELQAAYQWRPFVSQEEELLFVQVTPAPEHQKESLLNVMAIMSERGDLEDAIGEALESKQLGEWAAGDLGPGGMNMLFNVKNAKEALPVVIQTLEIHNVQSRARVARRLMTKSDEWRYEIVFPINFTGHFNSL
ncbi:hypothetical protein [Hymenobacter sp. B1770]|uniref:hypothetical protein n=1 Tax=Hymenobacter sp. B1770 TaxID=1718788 RepID=UPI003CF74FEB